MLEGMGLNGPAPQITVLHLNLALYKFHSLHYIIIQERFAKALMAAILKVDDVRHDPTPSINIDLSLYI